jgi:hypothetical protein
VLTRQAHQPYFALEAPSHQGAARAPGRPHCLAARPPELGRGHRPDGGRGLPADPAAQPPVLPAGRQRERRGPQLAVHRRPAAPGQAANPESGCLDGRELDGGGAERPVEPGPARDRLRGPDGRPARPARGRGQGLLRPGPGAGPLPGGAGLRGAPVLGCGRRGRDAVQRLGPLLRQCHLGHVPVRTCLDDPGLGQRCPLWAGTIRAGPGVRLHLPRAEHRLRARCHRHGGGLTVRPGRRGRAIPVLGSGGKGRRSGDRRGAVRRGERSCPGISPRP